jgi:hypothetical protein
LYLSKHCLGGHIQKDKTGGARNTYARKEKCIQVLVVKYEEKRRPGKPRHRWEHDIEMDLKETGWQYVDWFHQAQGTDKWLPLVKAVMNIRSP